MYTNYSNIEPNDISQSYLLDNFEDIKNELKTRVYIENNPGLITQENKTKIEFTDEDYLDNAKEKAITYITENILPVEEPKAMFLISQPGINNNSLLKTIKNNINNNTIEVKLKEIEKFHPLYKKLSKRNDFKSQRQLNQFSVDVYKSLTQKAIKDKLNIIYDTTFIGSYNMMENTMSNLKNNNHKIEINALSLNETISMIGVQFNEEVQHKETGKLVSPDFETHNEMYKSIPEKIEKAISYGYIDNCKLYGMDLINTKEVLLKEHNNNSFKEDYLTQRDKEFSLDEIDKIEKFQKDTETLMQVREASINEIEEFNNLINETKGSIAFSKVNFLDKEVSLELKDLIKDIEKANYNSIITKQCAGFKLDEKSTNIILENKELPEKNKLIAFTILEVTNPAKIIQENYLNNKNKTEKTLNQQLNKNKSHTPKL